MKKRKLHTVIERRCLSAEFVTQMEMGGAEAFRDLFGKFLRKVGGFLNTDACGEGGGFGKSVVYDNAKMNLANAARALPGSRGKCNAMGEKGKGKEDQ